MIDFSLLHFIRPMAWSLFPILLIAGWWFIYNKAQTVEWKNYLDEHLASWLLDSAQKQKKKSFLWPLLFVLCSFLVSFSAAGPSWEKQPVAISSITSKAIIVLDLSPSMVVEDILPSRLGRAKFKILEILKQWKQGYIGLVAFAEDGFIISPLTDDADTIANMVNILTPTIMPGEGSAADSGIRMALDLLSESELQHVGGDILLITDGVSNSRSSSIETLLEDTGVRLSVLSIGTKKGAPIPSQETAGFLTDDNGAIVIAKLDNAPLVKLALLHDGLFLSSKASNEDILSWLDLLKADFDNKTDEIENKKVERWIDQGALFLIPVLILMAFVFRKGFLFSFLLISLYIPDNNLYAATQESEKPPPQDSVLNKENALLEDSLWEKLWYNNTQLGDKKMLAERPELALQNYKKPEKIAEALYRAGLYKQAAELYAGMTGADARYNQANAQAQNRQLEQAIENYKQALQLNPDFEAAKNNLKTVEELLEQQKKQQENKEQNDKNKNENKDNKDNESQQKDENESDQEQDPNDQQQQQQGQQDDENKDSDEKPPEQEQQDQQQQKSEQQKQQQKDQQKPMTPEEKEAEKQKQQMIEQWLRQINDDPSRLLRNKLILEQRRREQSGKSSKQGKKEW